MTRSIRIMGIVFAGLIASAPARSYTETCRDTSRAEIESLFERWNNALKSGDPRQVVATYAPNSILLPTLSNEPRLTPEAKMEYFVHFLAKKPVGKIVGRAIEINCNSAVNSGLYTFTFGDGSQARARFTYTYKWDGQDWLITSHHSSLMPEK